MKLLFYRGKSLISRAIRFQTRSPYSHVAVQVGQNEYYEAWHVGGVRRLRYAMEGHSEGTPIDVYRVDGSYVRERVLEYLRSQVGKKYDFMSVARFLSRRKAPHNDKLFCSEYVMQAFAYGGLDLLHGKPSEMSPRDLSISPLLFYEGPYGH